ncbi:MAG: IclR family transcriptional regulator [Shinella sp.]|nr:IclR family transcriptional regulator [Shinella sp.]
MMPVEKERRSSGRQDTGTLGKAVSVLELVALAESPLRFTDILAASGQPRGTLHRQLSHLVEEGLVDLRPDHRYEPGLRLLRFASNSWARNQFRSVAEPHLRALHEHTGETVHLGILRGREIIYLDKVESRQAVRMSSQIGNASPAYCTGVGKAALSVLSDERLKEIVSGIDFHRFTPSTIADARTLVEELQEVRSRGFAFDREEHEAGICCVAAPVFSADRSLVGGISTTGPAYRVTPEQLAGWAPLVGRTAAAIMEDMRARLGPQR